MSPRRKSGITHVFCSTRYTKSRSSWRSRTSRGSPLDEEKKDEVWEAKQELVHVCEALKDGFYPLEAGPEDVPPDCATRTEILDYLIRPSNNTK